MSTNMYNERIYFAAANSFYGFKSNFDKVFDPRQFKKLYILKGGPGTGKSTLMKKIADHFMSDATVTKILCSSDTGSLDGVIIEKGNVKIGIADGTSPHAIEPRYPGAVEEIINLADGFDYRSLIGRRGEIIDLSDEKNESYKNAYKVLEKAGVLLQEINELLRDIGIYKKAESFATKITSHEKHGDMPGVNDIFLLSSFSKDGYMSLPRKSEKKDVITVKGDGFYEHIIMREVYKILSEKCTLKGVYYSPLSQNIIDTLESETHVYTVICGEYAGMQNSTIADKNSKYSELSESYKAALIQAQEYFKKASVSHFALEDIYSKNISFENNGKILQRVILEMDELFNK